MAGFKKVEFRDPNFEIDKVERDLNPCMLNAKSERKQFSKNFYNNSVLKWFRVCEALR